MATKPKHTIILVDDHILLRDSLSNVIDNFENFKVIAVASDGIEAVKIITEGKKPDIVLLDLNMPKMDGYETAKWLANNYPNVKIIILSMYDSDIAFIRTLEYGVRGFLKKDIHQSELQHALETVMEHGYYYTTDASSKIGSLLKKSNGAKSSLDKGSFTEKEIDFLKYTTTDMTYKEIAKKLKLSMSMIDNLREGLFEKVGVGSRVGLVMYAVKNGIVSF